MTWTGFARRGALAAALAVALVGWSAPPARAVAPIGACCLADGSCEDLTALQCDGPGQTFLGEGTSCGTTDCATPVAAPVLSIVGLVAAAGALAALGARRLIRGRGAR